MSGLIKHARREFKIAGWLKEPTDELQKMAMDNLEELISVFSKQGHSGFSASYILGLFNDLAANKVITPLTGEDGEWIEAYNGTMQNIRASHVFKDSDGKAYDIRGKVFVEKDGSAFTGKDSKVFIEFPYMPKTEYVNIQKEGENEPDEKRT